MNEGHRAHRVVVVGSGFGGLFAARELHRAPVEVTVISRTAYHLFQPLLYQVATGILSEGSIAPATREVLRRQRNARVLTGDVTRIDLAARTVTSAAVPGNTTVTPYDSLIVAAGAGQSYFGHDDFADHAPGMKTIDDALALRGRLFGSFELAELETDPAAIERWQTFVVIGGGPTGVEIAGQIAELTRQTLPGEFRNIDPARSRVILFEAGPEVLPSFGERLSGKAARELRRVGVELRTGTKVVGVDETGVDVVAANGTRSRIGAMTKVWAAGVAASPLGAQLAAQCGATVDHAGRITVEPDCTLPGHPEVFVVGDMMALDGLPGVAQVAMQSGRHAAAGVLRRLRDEPTQRFRYRDRGSMAIVARFGAVASVGRLRLAGFPAWLMWLLVHLLYLVGFRNRVTSLLDWAVAFGCRGRSERTVTRSAIRGLGPEPTPARQTDDRPR